MTATAGVERRTAEEIGTTPTGPRPLPALGAQRTVPTPEEADTVLAAARASGVTETPNLLRRFVELFARD